MIAFNRNGIWRICRCFNEKVDTYAFGLYCIEHGINLDCACDCILKDRFNYAPWNNEPKMVIRAGIWLIGRNMRFKWLCFNLGVQVMAENLRCK